jgi:hypothetical protein
LYPLTFTQGSEDQVRHAVLECIGSLTSAAIVEANAAENKWVVRNSTTGNFSLTFRVSGGTGLTVPQGQSIFVFSDGTSVFHATHNFANALPVSSGGTGVSTSVDLKKSLNAEAYNAIINGSFNVWQRGASFVSAVHTSYHADRWSYNKIGAMVHGIYRSDDVPTVAQAGVLYPYSLHLDCSVADAAIAVGDQCVLHQKIEGYRFRPIAQQSMTLSFWVKASKTGTYCVALVNGGGDRSYVAEYVVSAADTWEFETITVTASPAAGTWDYTTSVGLDVYFTLAAGGTFQTTPNTWQTGAYVATSNQVNACDSAANNFRITGVQLEKGTVASPFTTRSYDEELHLCKRYYQQLGVGGFGGSNTTTVCYLGWILPVETRVTAAVSLLDSTPAILEVGGVSSNGSGSLLSFGITPNGVNIQMGGFSGLTVGRAVIVNQLNNVLEVSAEL